MTGAVFPKHPPKGGPKLRKVIFSEKDLLAAEQLLERIRRACEDPQMQSPEDIWTHPKPVSAAPAVPVPAVNLDRKALVEKARRVLFNRRHRAKMFKKGMFGEPAWEMLLVLYVVDQGGRRHTIGSLTEVSGATMTTALRWLEFLEGERLIHRREHPTDRRSVFIELTDEARHALDVYFSGTR